MKPDEVLVELLINPCCVCERDFESVTGTCRELSVPCTVYNPWDIDDEDLPSLPPHVSDLIAGRRTGRIAGTYYSDVFVNGERIPLTRWPESFDALERRIEELLHT